MRLLLDEMFPHAVAVALGDLGHDVVSVQGDRNTLRHVADADVFAAAQRERRAVATENVVDYLAIVRTYQAQARAHWGLVLTSNKAFPRHRPASAIRALVAGFDTLLSQRADSPLHDEATSLVVWLQPTK